MVFLPAAVLAYLGLSKSRVHIEQDIGSFLPAAWQVADDVGPTAKLIIAAGLAALSAFTFLLMPLAV
jgi:hypothetical protein